MRLIAGIAGLLAFAPAAQAPAPSPTKVTVDVAVSPNRAGTPSRPKGVRVRVRASFTTPPAFERPVVSRVRVYLTKYGRYNGARFPSCSANTLNRRGPRACPARSIMGSATVDAYADEVITRPRITIVNGGARRAYLYTVLSSPARVQTAVEARITRLRGNPRYGYRVDATIPASLRVVAGVPIQPVRVRGQAGRGDWLASTGCPRDRLWRGEGTAYFDGGGDSGVVKAAVRCRPH